MSKSFWVFAKMLPRLMWTSFLTFWGRGWILILLTRWVAHHVISCSTLSLVWTYFFCWGCIDNTNVYCYAYCGMLTIFWYLLSTAEWLSSFAVCQLVRPTRLGRTTSPAQRHCGLGIQGESSFFFYQIELSLNCCMILMYVLMINVVVHALCMNVFCIRCRTLDTLHWLLHAKVVVLK